MARLALGILSFWTLLLFAHGGNYLPDNETTSTSEISVPGVIPGVQRAREFQYAPREAPPKQRSPRERFGDGAYRAFLAGGNWGSNWSSQAAEQPAPPAPKRTTQVGPVNLGKVKSLEKATGFNETFLLSSTTAKEGGQFSIGPVNFSYSPNGSGGTVIPRDGTFVDAKPGMTFNGRNEKGGDTYTPMFKMGADGSLKVGYNPVSVQMKSGLTNAATEANSRAAKLEGQAKNFPEGSETRTSLEGAAKSLRAAATQASNVSNGISVDAVQKAGEALKSSTDAATQAENAAVAKTVADQKSSAGDKGGPGNGASGNGGQGGASGNGSGGSGGSGAPPAGGAAT